jgi:hypothetical protein
LDEDADEEADEDEDDDEDEDEDDDDEDDLPLLVVALTRPLVCPRRSRVRSLPSSFSSPFSSPFSPPCRRASRFLALRRSVLDAALCVFEQPRESSLWRGPTAPQPGQTINPSHSTGNDSCFSVTMR